VQRLTCYQIHDKAPRIAPAPAERAWMDATDRRFAYRCLPLTIANAMGWELLSPARVTAEWNGGRELADIAITVDDPAWSEGKLAATHFGHGILTFHTGYLFRTDPGIGVWARGTPNRPKDGIAPLDGITETDWLTFTFTMNWQFTRPGRVVFEKGEPFCFLTLLAYRALEAVQPEIVPLAEEPGLQEQFLAWRQARLEFNEKLARDESDAARQGWQKFYVRGSNSPGGAIPSPTHTSKIVLGEPARRAATSAGVPD
jgi:hypothetical protein